LLSLAFSLSQLSVQLSLKKMSPLALLYILFASSPLLNNWHHESTSPSTWNAMPFEHESFEHYTPSFWGAEESTYTPEHLNWLLRKAVRSTEEERFPTSIRSIVAEMTGRRFFNNEEPRMFEQTESVRPIVHLIRRIAEVNPIMIEKILSCPITRRFVEKVLRNVEPETLRMVEKMIRKNVPVNIREKVVRRVLKNLLTKSSSVFGRRSILSEMYPTESIFEESTFNTRRHSEEPIRRMIEKLFSTRRYSKEEPMRRMIEKLFSTRRHFNVESVLRREVSPVEELFNTRRHSEEVEPMRRLVEELLSTRRHFSEEESREVSPVEELFSTRRHHDEERRTPSVWAIRRLLEKSTRRHESRRSSCPETRMIKKIVKIVKNIRENRNTERNTEMPEEFFCNYVCESNTHMRREFSNMCEKVCRNYESSWESPIFGKHSASKKMNKLIKKLSKEQF